MTGTYEENSTILASCSFDSLTHDEGRTLLNPRHQTFQTHFVSSRASVETPSGNLKAAVDPHQVHLSLNVEALRSYPIDSVSSPEALLKDANQDKDKDKDNDDEGVFSSIPFAVLFYMTISITMVLLNKYVLNQVSLPLSYLWLQLVISTLILLFFHNLQWINIQDLDLANKWKDIAPLIVINVLGLSLNTFCLVFLDASLYQIARSLVLPLTVAFSWAFMGQLSSLAILLSCVVIFVGFLIGIVFENEIDISLIGILFGLASSVTTAYHSIVIKKSFDFFSKSAASKMSSSSDSTLTFDMAYWNNYLSFILLIPFVLLFEGPRIYTRFVEVCFVAESSSLEYSLDFRVVLTFIIGSVLAGISGLLVNIAGFLQIRVTSPITHTVSSAARGVLQTLLAWWILQEILTSFRIAGIVVTSVGTCSYTFFKTRENRKKEIENKQLPVSMTSPLTILK